LAQDDEFAGGVVHAVGAPVDRADPEGEAIGDAADRDPKSDRQAMAEANELAAAHIDLVQQIVNQVAMRYPRHVDRNELWSAGSAGLVEASRSYRAETGIPFPRYASIRIRGAIIDSTRKRDWAVRSLRRRMRELHDAEDRFEVAEGRKPTDVELARMLGLNTDELRRQRSASVTSSLLHLDQEDPEKVPLGERIEERAEDRLPDEMLDKREMLGTLRVAIEELPDLQKEVVRRYYLGGEMLQTIAAELGVTEARVSQIRAEAVNAMRAWFRTMYDGVAEVPSDAPGRRGRAAYLATLATHSTWRQRMDAADVAAAERAAAEAAADERVS
jgi:RNA polymerase sigma factor FliA